MPRRALLAFASAVVAGAAAGIAPAAAAANPRRAPSGRVPRSRAGASGTMTTQGGSQITIFPYLADDVTVVWYLITNPGPAVKSYSITHRDLAVNQTYAPQTVAVDAGRSHLGKVYGGVNGMLAVNICPAGEPCVSSGPVTASRNSRARGPVGINYP